MEIKLLLLVAAAISEVLCSCKPKDVTLTNFQNKQKRSVGQLVGVTAVKCPGLEEFYYKWEIKEMPGNRVVHSSSRKTIFLRGYDFDSKVVFEKTYEVTVAVSHYPDMTYSSSATDTVEFEPNEMDIRIYGGAEKTHLVNSKLVVDALTQSRDLSYPSSEDVFAGNTIKWTVTPEIENYTPPQEMKIEVPGEFLKLGQTYKFTITVTRTKIPKYFDEKTASQLVEVVSAEGAEINIKCIRNCLNPNHLEATAFAVECVKNCDHLNYKWSIQPSIDSGKTDFGNGHDKFLVQENSYKPGDTITVLVKSGKSRSSMTLTFISGLSKGTCSISPNEGVSGVTKFKVKCMGFLSPYGLMVYMIYQKCEEVEGGVLLNEDSFKEESDIYLTEDAPAVVRVLVQDNAYLQEEIELSAQVKPFSLQGNMSKIEAIKTLVLNRDFSAITAYSIEGFSNEVVQMTSLLLTAIKECQGKDNSTVKDLHKHMGESLFRTDIPRFTSSIQAISILGKLQKFKLDTDTATSRYIGKIMVNAALTAYRTHSTEGEVNIPQALLNKYVVDNLRLASEQMKKVEEIESVLVKPTPPHDYDSYDEYVSEKLKIRDDLRELVTNVIVSIQVNGISALYRSIPDQKGLFFESEFIHFTTRRLLLSSVMHNQTISLSNVTKSKTFIPKPLVEELQEAGNYVDYQFGVFKKNPFWWHRNSSAFNTEFILFDLFRKAYKIETVKNPFYVHLQAENIPIGKLRGNLTEKNIGAHRIEVEPGTMLVAVFEASDETYNVTSSNCFCKEDDFSKGVAIEKGTNDSQRTLTARPVKDAKVIYVCIMKSGPKLSYEGNFAIFSCVYWNGRGGKWESSGCEVQNAALQNSSLMVCKCSHLSLFTGKIFVAPNPLNLEVDVDFTIAFVENRTMVITVAVLLLMWLVALILAHFRDKALKKKNIVCKLNDNVPGDCHVYLIVVFTGFFFDAGTTADVAFQIIGDRAKSRVHLMKCQDATLLKKNSQDWFIIFTPFYLGQIRKIKIWHNSKGSKPHWYCARIIVEDLKTGQQYYFSVNKWFSLVWGNGKVYREIRAGKVIRKNRKLLFFTQIENAMKDKHLWMSIMVRDTQSNFNSKERVSCAFCFVFLSMLASAMFHGIPQGVPADSIDKTTSYHITLFHVVIFIESWLIATPLGMIIVMLFKNSAPRS